MADWKDAVVSPETPLGDAIAKVDTSGLQVALVLAQDDTLLGILTDGNIRRAILAGKSLQAPVSDVMMAHPTTIASSAPRNEMLALMRSRSLHHLPLINPGGTIVGLVTLDELIGAAERPNWVVLMAGGLGTRLRPLTDEYPKPLLEVGGKPILETILSGFAEQGFKRIFLSVNFKAEMIREHFGSGDRWGVQVEYLHEGTRLGTAGALSLLPETPTAPILVMNGDLLTRVNYDNLMQFHIGQGAVATMAVREYDFQVPYGVVHLDGTHIESIEEKPIQKHFINAGIYVLSPEVLDYLPNANSTFDMTTLFEQLLAVKRPVAAYPLHEYWQDIGGLKELEQAQMDWSTVPNQRSGSNG